MLYFYEDIKDNNFFLWTQHFDRCVFKPTVWQCGSRRLTNRVGYDKLLFKLALCIMYTRESSWNSDFNTVEYDRPQHDRSAVWVIAPNGILPLPSSLGTFITARKNSGCAPKTIIFQFYILYKFRYSESA